MAGAALESSAVTSPFSPGVRSHDSRRAHPLIDRHGGDVAIAGQEMDGRVDVRVGAAYGQDARLKIAPLS
jgi:hypothetical protein